MSVTKAQLIGNVSGGAVFSGNVGIGTTTSPTTTLDVNGDVTITDKIIHGGDTNTAIRFPAADTVSVETNGSERLRITSAGLVGIGTTNPTVALQLSPNASISNLNASTNFGTTAGAAATVAQFYHLTGNASYLRIKATRNTAGSDWTTASTKLLQVIDVTEQGYIEYNPNGANSGMAFGSGATEWARFLQNGNLGIGTTNPTHKLHVLGDARITGILTVGTGSITLNGSTNTISGITTINTTSINDGPLAGFRNKIINGAMEISARGTSFAAASGYTLDRFSFGTFGSGVVTVTQSADAPNNTFQYSLKVDVTTADTSIAAGDYGIITHKIEGYNVRDLIGQTFTLSFWVKSPKTGTHCVAFRNSTPDRSFVMEYTVSAANTWEYKSVTVTGGLITTGTWDWTNGTGLNVNFTLATGTTYQTTAGAWQTGNLIGTSNQVNVLDNTANDFYLTGVQLEPGPVATRFERRPIGTELALCQRYYEVANVNRSIFSGNVTNGHGYRSNVAFQVVKRDLPTVTLTNTETSSFSATVGSLAVGIGGFAENRTANSTEPGIYVCNWTASAEL